MCEIRGTSYKNPDGTILGSELGKPSVTEYKRMRAWLLDYFGMIQGVVRTSCQQIEEMRKDYDAENWDSDWKFHMGLDVDRGQRLIGDMFDFEKIRLKDTVPQMSMYLCFAAAQLIINSKVMDIKEDFSQHVTDPIPRDIAALLQTLFADNLLADMIVLSPDAARRYVEMIIQELKALLNAVNTAIGE